MSPIRTVAAVIANEHGHILLVRKRASRTFIQPGGKAEPGEEPQCTLARELEEELGVTVIADSVIFIGEFEADAVNEAGRRVRAQAYSRAIEGTPVACAEIEELAWIDPRSAPSVTVAPLSALHILPAYLAMRDAQQ